MLGTFDDVRSDDLTARGRERAARLGAGHHAAGTSSSTTGTAAYARLAAVGSQLPRRFDSLPGLG